MGFLTAVHEQLFQTVSEAIIKHPWLLGADGQNTINFGRQKVMIALNIVCVLGGIVLMVPSVIHIVKALMGDNKDWKKALVNLAVGVIGLVITIAGGTGMYNAFNNSAQDFNIR